MNIKQKLVITFLLLTTVPMLFVGYLTFANAGQALRQKTLESMRNIADGKEAEILTYLGAKKDRATDFSTDGFIRAELERLSILSDSKERIDKNGQLVAHLKTSKKPIDPELLDVHIYDLDGNLIASTGQGETEKRINDSNAKFFLEGKKESYLEYFTAGNGHEEESFIAASAPIKSMAGGKVIGVLMNSYKLDDIKNILSGTRAHGLGALTTTEYNESSLDILIVDQNKKFLVPSRTVSAEKAATIVITSEPVLKCLGSGEEINKEWTDYRGIQVFGASMCPQVEKDWKWALIVKQDVAEALAPINNLRNISLIVGILTMFFSSLVALFVAKSISDPIQKLTKTANDISQGRMDTQLEKIDSKDEVGDLARAFERTIVSLKLAMKQVDPLKTTVDKNKTIAKEMGKTMEEFDAIIPPPDKKQ